MCRTRAPSFPGLLFVPLRQLNDLEAVLGREALVLLGIERLARRWQLDAGSGLTHLLVEDLQSGGDRDLQQVALRLEAQPVRHIARQPQKGPWRGADCFVATGAGDPSLQQGTALILLVSDV